MGLFDPTLPLEACQEAALARFNQLTALSADPNVEKERAGIASAVAIALGELRQYLLAWSGEAELEEGWNQFLADAEWAAIKVASRKVSDEPVLAIEEIRLEAVGFSAALA